MIMLFFSTRPLLKKKILPEGIFIRSYPGVSSDGAKNCAYSAAHWSGDFSISSKGARVLKELAIDKNAISSKSPDFYIFFPLVIFKRYRNLKYSPNA